MKNTLSALLFALLIFTQPAPAQDVVPERTLSIEVNPLAYAFTGWSIGGTYHPAPLNRWVFNAGAYGFQLPDVFVEQIPGNEDEGFELEISPAATIGADFYPWSRNRSGLAFGVSTVVAGFEVTNENEPGRAHYTSLYVVPRASYTWFVFRGLYVMPWVGIEIHNKIRGDTQVGTLDFEPMTTQFSPNIAIGYYFN
jgi:hypothetical protein